MFNFFTKQIETKIKKKVFYLEGTMDINSDYFIQEIEKGIINSTNNHLTNVKGFMTSWDYFLHDEKFKEVFINLINEVEYHACVNTDTKNKWSLKNCWGIKQVKSNYTLEHDHLPNSISGIIYLNNSKQALIFNEINQKLIPEKGKFAVFSSILKHHTERNLEDVPKYAISFNIHKIMDF
jgi:hypothetical protein